MRGESPQPVDQHECPQSRVRGYLRGYLGGYVHSRVYRFEPVRTGV